MPAAPPPGAAELRRHSPSLCGQELIVVRGSLVVVLPVADDGGQALAHQRFGDVAARQKREGGSEPARGPRAWHRNQGKDEETP